MIEIVNCHIEFKKGWAVVYEIACADGDQKNQNKIISARENSAIHTRLWGD